MSLLKGLALGILAFEALSDASKRHEKMAGARRGRGLGDGDPAGVRRVENHSVKNIDERCAFIKKAMIDGSYDPKVISAARRLVTQKCGDEWCIAPKDYRGEAQAIFKAARSRRVATTLFDAVQKPTGELAIRYTRDHAIRDQFSSTQLMRRLPGEDCDGQVVWLGAHLLAIGFCPEMVVIQSKQSPSWDHIYLQVTLDNGHKMALDTTEPHPAGWEVPKSMVTRKKVIPVCP